MKVEFDPAKDAANLAKHGVGLDFGLRVFADPFRLVIDTSRDGDGEERLKTVGMVDGKLWTAIHTDREVSVRMISVRRSNDGERREYEALSG
ncbi:MAG: BrnT family toxin [Sphingomonadaceae bacterium]|nr:BrnT family toxin [Sphingomonadaceae bacterium]